MMIGSDRTVPDNASKEHGGVQEEKGSISDFKKGPAAALFPWKFQCLIYVLLLKSTGLSMGIESVEARPDTHVP
jgi:hypothetical protein